METQKSLTQTSISLFWFWVDAEIEIIGVGLIYSLNIHTMHLIKAFDPSVKPSSAKYLSSTVEKIVKTMKFILLVIMI